MKNLFYRCTAFVLRYPLAFSLLLLVLVFSVPRIVEAQGAGACYAAGYGSACDGSGPPPPWLEAAMAILLFGFFAGMGWVSWL